MRITLKPNAKLSPQQVVQIRKRLSMGITTVAEEAAKHGVGRETIRRANRGETFSEVLEEGADFRGTPKPVAPPVSEDEANEALERMMKIQKEIKETKSPHLQADAKQVLEHTSWAAELLGHLKESSNSNPEAAANFGSLVEEPKDEKIDPSEDPY